MDAKRLIELRRQAEKAVAEMPDGELKVKAFEVILANLLGTSAFLSTRPPEMEEEVKPKASKGGAPAKTAAGRILVLRGEGFFKNQRTIGEIQEELRAHGWHYPMTTLGARLQDVVQRRQLRRERAKHGKKKVWKYSNP